MRRAQRAGCFVVVSVLCAAALPVATASGRIVHVHQRGTPEATLTVPAGWRAHVTSRYLRLARGRDRVAVRVCLLDREERDMTGRHAASQGGVPHVARNLWGANGAYLAPAAGGGCVVVTGRGARSVAGRLHARLGPPGPAPPSDAAAERAARLARARTVGQPRAVGTAFALPFGRHLRIESAWEWDLTAGYRHQVQQGAGMQYEVLRDSSGDHLRVGDATCWGLTRPADEDDALEPRLELHEWDAPPSSSTAWRVAYAPPEPQPDGSVRVRWTAFVADGEALIGRDGLLRFVHIVDHHRALGRTIWRVVEVDFTQFPAAITPVTPQPACA
jgi:hypothetical protein